MCGNVVVKTVDSGVPLVCCGETMEELAPNTVDGLGEKHLPVVTRPDECTVEVRVGSIPHPMLPEHSIRFIYLETENGGQIRFLQTPFPAIATFCGCKDRVVAVYEYCNLHGLWKTTDIPVAPGSCKPDGSDESSCKMTEKESEKSRNRKCCFRK